MHRIIHLQRQLLPNQALLITDPLNIRYLAGFTGSSSFLLLSPRCGWLITDYRYVEQAQHQCSTVAGSLLSVICRDRSRESLAACIRRLLPVDIAALALEYHHLSVQSWQELHQSLPEFALTGWGKPVEHSRAIKQPIELALIRQAVHIAEQALAATLPQIRLGMTEAQVAAILEQQLYANGAEGLSFPTILLSGERSALPHGKPGTRPLAQGDFLLIDFGAMVQGYRSDITRTYILGQASAEQIAFYQTVYQAQQAALAGFSHRPPRARQSAHGG